MILSSQNLPDVDYEYLTISKARTKLYKIQFNLIMSLLIFHHLHLWYNVEAQLFQRPFLLIDKHVR